MFFPNIAYCPAEFAGKILISTVNLSPKTKAFLKGKAKTVLDFYKNGKRITLSAPTNMQAELTNFHSRVDDWMNIVIKGLHFSKNIPPPKQKVRGEERIILIALLLAEPMFGNRRRITQARHIHLPRLYEEQPSPEVKSRHHFCSFRTLQKLKIAS